MCGIVGIYGFKNQNFLNEIRRMSAAIKQRGPDDSGEWAETGDKIAFGHRRLSIVDLSDAGHQPMKSLSKRWTITFNGEIYNHLEIRKALNLVGVMPNWRGYSDTETLLEAINHWGVEEALHRCVGMFAFALWDSEKKELTLARDRLGEKPLYYGWCTDDDGSSFLFGSELKALRAYSNFKNEICRQALSKYFQFMYVPAPRSIYKDIYKLEPGCFLTISGKHPNAPLKPLRPGQSHGNLSIKRWWSLKQIVEKSSNTDPISESNAVDKLESLLLKAVTLQTQADVPLGAFLSGGVDSSTIVALMQKNSKRPVKTFTISFDEKDFDEAPYARAVANFLGTEHHEMMVCARTAQDLIPSLPHMYDEPFADSSQIPTYLVSRAAKEHVTVALSGDAGDELFGGYNRYFWGPKLWKRLQLLPLPMRDILSKSLLKIRPEGWNSIGAFVARKNAPVNFGVRVHKLAERLMQVNDMDSLYKSLVSEWSDPASLVLGVEKEAFYEASNLLDDPMPNNYLEQPLPMMYRDALTYLPDDILCKVDRASMACSLEARVPFLDHRVVEFAWQLPLSMKIRGNTGKWALRQVLYKYVPKDLIERPKAGFAIPIGRWLRGPLREWAEDLLSESKIKNQGYLDPLPIRKIWSEHLIGNYDHTSKLWSVLMFQAWVERNP